MYNLCSFSWAIVYKLLSFWNSNKQYNLNSLHFEVRGLSVLTVLHVVFFHEPSIHYILLFVENHEHC